MVFTNGNMFINVNLHFSTSEGTVLFPVLHFNFLNKQEKDEQRRVAEAKKTDAVSPDDDHDDASQEAPVKAASKSQLEVQEEEEEVGEEEEAESSGGEVDAEEPKTEVN